MSSWTGRSHFAAAAGVGLLLAALLVFTLQEAYQDPMWAFGFPAAALAFHAGFGLAALGGLRREDGAPLAMALHAVPVILFWGAAAIAPLPFLEFQ